MAHRFRLGSKVALTHDRLRSSSTGGYTVLRQLPVDGRDEPQYRIKSARETCERVVPESQLMPLRE